MGLEQRLLSFGIKINLTLKIKPQLKKGNVSIGTLCIHVKVVLSLKIVPHTCSCILTMTIFWFLLHVCTSSMIVWFGEGVREGQSEHNLHMICTSLLWTTGPTKSLWHDHTPSLRQLFQTRLGFKLFTMFVVTGKTLRKESVSNLQQLPFADKHASSDFEQLTFQVHSQNCLVPVMQLKHVILSPQLWLVWGSDRRQQIGNLAPSLF